jgi:hypothetical protein
MTVPTPAATAVGPSTPPRPERSWQSGQTPARTAHGVHAPPAGTPRPKPRPQPDETQEPDAEPVVPCNPEKREAWGDTCPHTNGRSPLDLARLWHARL